MTVIRPFASADHDAWMSLWALSTEGKVDDIVTRTTWKRLLSSKDSVHGLGLWQDQTLCAFLHYILHTITGAVDPACYMQDVFVHPDHRRLGYAKRLVWELGDLAKTSHWARVYWLTDRQDVTAQSLYKTLGITLDFTLHFLPLQRN
jgi:GNAT superfamily N-acetyltransferase